MANIWRKLFVMRTMDLMWLIAGVVIGTIGGWILFRSRLGEVRNLLSEIRERERQAKEDLQKAAEKHTILDTELKLALEDKGKYKSEAARIGGVESVLAGRDAEINSLREQVAALRQEKTGALKDAEAANKRADEMVCKEREATVAILAAKDDQILKLNEFIDQARGVLTTEFKALSADALKDASAQLAKTADGIIERHGKDSAADIKLNKQHIETMLKPVEETIKRLDQHVAESDLTRSKAEALLDEQMKRLAGASESLSNALRKPVIRGSWGEMTLENALESAGLEAEIDFVLQHSTDAEDGRKRTDAVITLPKGRKLIIDSKNLMESYIKLASADESQRASLSELHSKSLRTHIKALSAQEYWRRYEGLDCVILFIPHDGMYHAAIKDEADLIREACDRRVFISNPMSLIPLLKAIRYVLNQDKQNKSAADISRVGMDLYREVTRFAENLAVVGSKLKATVKAYNDAIPGLDRYIVGKSRELKQLGSAVGVQAELPESIELEPKPFSSRELRSSNRFLEDDLRLDIAASSTSQTSKAVPNESKFVRDRGARS